DENVMIIPGTDGNKMSKSRNNFIDIFQSDKALKKQIMGIVTVVTPLEEPKNTDSCNVFALYKLLATLEQTAQMKENYLVGNYVYVHTNTTLFELIVDKYKDDREKYDYFMSNR